LEERCARAAGSKSRDKIRRFSGHGSKILRARDRARMTRLGGGDAARERAACRPTSLSSAALVE
jgi:hypothetical protein